MKKINLAISGCMGRMGQQLIKSSKKNKNFKLVTITDQINKFLINLFDFELDSKNSGSTSIKTAIKKIAGMISSNPIL